MYRVRRDFYDLTDYREIKGGRIYHQYKAGEMYPRDGIEPSQERIEQLMSGENRMGISLIEPLEDVPAPVTKTEEVTEGKAEETKEEKPKRKPRKKAVAE